MKYKSLFLILMAFLGYAFMLSAQDRKRVAIVLSGGGAKGVAHIGALKVIEKAGIPVDYIVGTSMGAIVGGLYSIGYTPHQLDSMVNAQDWKYLLSDSPNPQTQLLSQKLEQEQYLLSIPFAKKASDLVEGGIIKGRNIARLLSELTAGYHDSLSFNRLPVPFSCVATNIVNGSVVAFHQGILATAMRSSMSIPGIFAPVYISGMVLVDGGLVDNYPVGIALKMGADLIIGIDVQSKLMKADDLTNLSSILGQIVNLSGEDSYKRNVEASNIHIQVDVEGYSAASFNHNALDTLMRKGEEAALQNWDKLIALKKEIGLSPDYRPQYPAAFNVLSPAETVLIPNIPQITPPNTPVNSINIGGRFDNEELAVLLLNANYYPGKQKKTHLSLTTQLGKHIFGRLNGIYSPQKSWEVNLGYQLGYNDFNLYHSGRRLLNLTYIHQLAQINLTKSWHRILISAGIQFEKYNYRDWLSVPDIPITQARDDALFSYQTSIKYNNLNDRRLSTKGIEWEVSYGLYTDNLFSYHSQAAVSVFQANWTGYFSPIRKFTLIPSFHGRMLSKESQSLSIKNFIGGNTSGRYLPQQIPFTGINYIEESESVLLTGNLQLRWLVCKNQYILFNGSYGRTTHKLHYLFNDSYSSDLTGGGIGYCYNSIIGPIEVGLNYSIQSKKIGYYIGVGYAF